MAGVGKMEHLVGLSATYWCKESGCERPELDKFEGRIGELWPCHAVKRHTRTGGRIKIGRL